MKTAISLSDELFAQVDVPARRLARTAHRIARWRSSYRKYNWHLTAAETQPMVVIQHRVARCQSTAGYAVGSADDLPAAVVPPDTSPWALSRSCSGSGD